MRPLGLAAAAMTLLLTMAQAARAADTVDMRDLVFDSPAVADMEAGGVSLPREPVYWQSDGPWLITVEVLELNLGSSDDGRYLKPLGDLQFKRSEDAVWRSMEITPLVLASGGAGGKGSFLVDWRMALDWAKDRPGRYRATLRLTIHSR